jgi:hypothetical protein
MLQENGFGLLEKLMVSRFEVVISETEQQGCVREAVVDQLSQLND